jgi:hypothetical protein
MLIVSGLSEENEHVRAGHPERPERIAAVVAGIEDLHLGADLYTAPPRVADRAQLLRVHAAGYLDELAAPGRAETGAHAAEAPPAHERPPQAPPAGGARDVGGHDVGGVMVERNSGPLVAHGRSWVGVRRGFLNVA